MHITSNLGMLLLSIYLILIGLGSLGLPIPAILTDILALIAGVLILLGK